MIAKSTTYPKSKGFSLIEMLVLMAVIAILAGISGVALMKWIHQANLKRAARTIVSMCQDARVEAIKRNQMTSIECNKNNNICLVRLENGSTFRTFNLSTLNSKIKLEGSFNTTFNGRGRSSQHGTIPIKNSSGKILTVSVRNSGSIVTK